MRALLLLALGSLLLTVAAAAVARTVAQLDPTLCEVFRCP